VKVCVGGKVVAGENELEREKCFEGLKLFD
jgi:hypothetical protein